MSSQNPVNKGRVAHFFERILPKTSLKRYILISSLCGMIVYILSSLFVPHFYADIAFIISCYFGVCLLFSIIRKKYNDQYVEILYRYVYKPSYVRLLIGFVIASIAFVLAISAVDLILRLFASGANAFGPNSLAAIPLQHVLGVMIGGILCGVWGLLLPMFVISLVCVPVHFVLMVTRWCPNCGKFFGLRVTDRKVVDSQAISMKKTLEIKNARGEVIGTNEQYIPGTRETTQTVKTCKYCGAEVENYRTSDHENV
ncbi:MAG: hypothetical protein MR415_00935 [Coriobacteriaceae bacterium]|nr:hypothetical protein [Coriobacteriaceae bacterium]